jgi:hypothetical protein
LIDAFFFLVTEADLLLFNWVVAIAEGKSRHDRQILVSREQARLVGSFVDISRPSGLQCLLKAA